MSDDDWELNEEQANTLAKVDARWAKTVMTEIRRKRTGTLLDLYDHGLPNRCPLCRLTCSDVPLHLDHAHNAEFGVSVMGYPKPNPNGMQVGGIA